MNKHDLNNLKESIKDKVYLLKLGKYDIAITVMVVILTLGSLFWKIQF